MFYGGYSHLLHIPMGLERGRYAHWGTWLPLYRSQQKPRASKIRRRALCPPQTTGVNWQ